MNWTNTAGAGVNNILTGFLDPAAGALNKALGSSTSTETSTPTGSSKTGTIVIAALAVITLIVVGIIIFKKSKA